jgi:hypothetical protein
MAPDTGLAYAIGITMILIVLTGLLAGILLGRILARRLGWSGAKRLLAILGLSAIGVGGGALVVIANFYEDIWAPPPQVTFNTPPGFAQNWVIVLEDPLSPVQLVWKGPDIPFFGTKAVIDVPSSGIVRLRDDLGRLHGRGDINILWSDGAYHSGYAGGPAPKSTGATVFSAFNRVSSGEDRPAQPPFNDDAALGAYIVARERGAQ